MTPSWARTPQNLLKHSQLARVSLSPCHPFDFDKTFPWTRKHHSLAFFGPHQAVWTLQVLRLIFRPSRNLCLLCGPPTSKDCIRRGFLLFFCRRHVFESVWMWGKVHFRADIPSLCLCSQRCLLSTSLFPFSSAEKQILGPLHFWKNTFFWGAFDKWNQNPLLKLVLSSVKPFTTSVGLKNASVRFFRVEKR